MVRRSQSRGGDLLLEHEFSTQPVTGHPFAKGSVHGRNQYNPATGADAPRPAVRQVWQWNDYSSPSRNIDKTPSSDRPPDGASPSRDVPSVPKSSAAPFADTAKRVPKKGWYSKTSEQTVEIMRQLLGRMSLAHGCSHRRDCGSLMNIDNRLAGDGAVLPVSSYARCHVWLLLPKQIRSKSGFSGLVWMFTGRSSLD